MDKAYLRNLGKTAAREYLEENIPLNNSIAKLAMRNHLNREQIKRVSEFANHIVTASMYKAAQSNNHDLYIDFPLADANAVMDIVSEKKLAEFVPSSPVDEYHLPVDMVIGGMKKAAADNSENTQDIEEVAVKLAKMVNKLISQRNQVLQEAHGSADVTEYVSDKLYKAIIQELKNGSSIFDIKAALKEKLGDSFDKVWDTVKERLAADNIIERKMKPGEVTISDESIFNQDNDVVKTAEELNKQLKKLNMLASRANSLEKTAEKAVDELHKLAIAGVIGRTVFKRILPTVVKATYKAVWKPTKLTLKGGLWTTKKLVKKPMRALDVAFYGSDIVGKNQLNPLKYM